MTKDVTFIFKKNTGSLDLRCIEALQGYTPIAVKRDAISSAVSDIFERLIARDASKFKTAILGLSSFLVTFSNGGQPKLKVESGEGDVEIHLNKLSAQTAALFSNSIYAPQTSGSKAPSTEEKARSSADKLRQESLPKAPNEEKLKTQKPPEPVPVAIPAPIVVQPVQVALTTPPANDITSVAPSQPVAVTATPPSKVLTQEEQMQGTIASLMIAQFTDSTIQRSAGSEEEFFGAYLMQRVFGKIDSCHFNFETLEFTLNFAKNKEILLANLPEGKSPEQLKALKNLHGATLSIAKQVKGKFNIDEGKLTFQPGCLKLNWTWSSAELLGIFQGQNNRVIMQINYLGIHKQGPVPAQDFVDIIECNVTK